MTLYSGQLKRRAAWLSWPLPPVVIADQELCALFVERTVLPQLTRLWIERYGEDPPGEDVAELTVEVRRMTEADSKGGLRMAFPGEHTAEVHVHVTLTGPAPVRG